jgi:hypothetical protein
MGDLRKETTKEAKERTEIKTKHFFSIKLTSVFDLEVQ